MENLNSVLFFQSVDIISVLVGINLVESSCRHSLGTPAHISVRFFYLQLGDFQVCRELAWLEGQPKIGAESNTQRLGFLSLALSFLGFTPHFPVAVVVLCSLFLEAGKTEFSIKVLKLLL